MPPAPAGRDRRWPLLGAVAAALVLVVGAVVVANRGGVDDGAAAATSTTLPRPAGGVVTVPAGTVTSPTPPPTTGSTTVPATTTPVTTPTTTAPATTVPAVTVAPPGPGPSRAELEASLVTAADLPDGAWVEIPFVEGPPFCGATPEAGLLDEVTRQFQVPGIPLPVIVQSTSTYASAESAAAEFTAATDVIADCPVTTYDIEGFTYSMQTDVTPVTPADVPLPCSDQAAAITVALTSVDSPIPFLGQYAIAIRCGLNVAVVSVGTDQLAADPPADFVAAATVAAVRLAALPGSTG
jgi:hypothetical protein